MAQPNSLYLHQQVLLLALDDDKGTFHNATLYQYALAGAVVAELLLSNKIEIEGDKSLKLIDEKPFGDLTLDRWLIEIKAAKKAYSAKSLINKIACRTKFKDEIAQELCKQGVLNKETDKVLFFFNRTIYPERNSQPEKRLIQQLEQAIFGNQSQIEPRTAIMVALAHASGLLDNLFGKPALKQRKLRIEEIANGALVNQATKTAIQEFHTLMLVTCIMPAVTASTTSIVTL